MKHSQEIISKIAQELDCGFNCYYNTQTHEIITIPDFADHDDEFSEYFHSEDKIDTENVIKIDSITSSDSYEIMEKFVEQITEIDFKIQLTNTLQNKNPFQNFKHLIDNSDVRQQWFDFKQTELEKIVVEKIEEGYLD